MQVKGNGSTRGVNTTSILRKGHNGKDHDDGSFCTKVTTMIITKDESYSRERGTFPIPDTMNTAGNKTRKYGSMMNIWRAMSH